MMKYYFKNQITCPKPAEFPIFLKTLCWKNDLKLEIDIDESGWIFKQQHIRFKIESDSKEKLEAIQKQILESVEDYQNSVNKIY